MSMLVFDHRLSNADTVANLYTSSEASGFPIENALDVDRRKRKWRSAGAYTVVDGYNTLVFRETIGVDLTATIAAGEYVSYTAFFAALKTALEDAGASTYTVERDATTARVKITSNGGGGGGIFQLMLTNGASADVAALLGFSTSSDLTGALNYTADLLVIHTSEWITFDFAGPVNPTGFFIAGDRNAPLQISPDATVKLQASWTNAWNTPAEEFTVTYRDYILALSDEDGIATMAYRYWRVMLIDPQNYDGYIEAGVLFLGTHILTTRSCPAFPLVASGIDRTSVAFSEGGQTLAVRRPKAQNFRLNWEKLDNASVELLQEHFENFGTHSSFVIAMDQGSVFSTNGDSWVRIVKFESAPEMQLVRPGLWDCNWTLREEL